MCSINKISVDYFWWGCLVYVKDNFLTELKHKNARINIWGINQKRVVCWCFVLICFAMHLNETFEGGQANLYFIRGKWNWISRMSFYR